VELLGMYYHPVSLSKLASIIRNVGLQKLFSKCKYIGPSGIFQVEHFKTFNFSENITVAFFRVRLFAEVSETPT
jgi:hypothetical protein